MMLSAPAITSKMAANTARPAPLMLDSLPPVMPPLLAAFRYRPMIFRGRAHPIVSPPRPCSLLAIYLGRGIAVSAEHPPWARSRAKDVGQKPQIVAIEGHYSRSAGCPRLLSS